MGKTSKATTLYRCVVCDCFISSSAFIKGHTSGCAHKHLLKIMKLGNDPGLQPVHPDQQIPCKACNTSVRGDDWRKHENSDTHIERLKICESRKDGCSGREYCMVCDVPLAADELWKMHRQSFNHRVARRVPMKEEGLSVRIQSLPAEIISTVTTNTQDPTDGKLPRSGLTTSGSTQSSSHSKPNIDQEPIEVSSSSNSNDDDKPARAPTSSSHARGHTDFTQKEIVRILPSRLRLEPSSSSSYIDADDKNGDPYGKEASRQARATAVIVISDSEDEVSPMAVDAEVPRNPSANVPMDVDAATRSGEIALPNAHLGAKYGTKDLGLQHAQGNTCSGNSSLDTDNEGSEEEVDQLQDDEEMDVDADQEEADEDRRAFNIVVNKLSPQILRLVGFDSGFERLLNKGRLRLIAKRDGVEHHDALSLREIESFDILCNVVPRLREELLRMSEDKVQDVAANMSTRAIAGRGADVQKAKNNIIEILVHLDEIPEARGNKLAVKAERGFKSKLGKMLCPVDLDWKDAKVRLGIRNGEIEVTADQYPRGIYKDCECDTNNYDKGLLKNKALVHLGKLIFTGRRSAFTAKGGPPKARTNAKIANMNEMTPRAIAYCACLMRFSISDKLSWSFMDGDFDIIRFYWNIVGIFDGSKTANRILRWWNKKIFGTKHPKAPKRPPETLMLLQSQREAKRSRTES